jgi:bacterial/archaeal transporter family-2 protein
MLTLLAVFAGALAAVSIAQNGDLSAYLGNFRATVVVHAVGLATILLWLLLRRRKIVRDPATPWYAYFGGVLGVLTVYVSNLGLAALGISATVALMLLGQTLMGAAVDQFGLLGTERRPFRPQHLISFALVAGGIVVMLAV